MRKLFKQIKFNIYLIKITCLNAKLLNTIYKLRDNIKNVNPFNEI